MNRRPSSPVALRRAQVVVDVLLILGFIALIAWAQSDDDMAADRDRAADYAQRTAQDQPIAKNDK